MNKSNKMFRLVSLFALSFFVAALQTGCDNEDIVCECPDDGGNSGDNGPGEGPADGNMLYMTFTAGSELNETKSRTQIGKGDSVNWQKGDEMSVFNIKSESSVIFKTEDDKTTNATFAGYIEPSNDGNYLALYPYNKLAKLVEYNGRIQVKSFINPNQVVPSTGGYDPKSCHSFSVLKKNDKDKLYGSMKLLGGMLGLKFDIQLKKSPLASIEISLVDQSSVGHPHIGGNYTIDISKPESPVATFDYAESHEIIVTTDEKGFQSDTEYLISLPAISKPVDLFVTFVREDGWIYTQKIRNFTLERAHIKPVTKLPLTDGNFKQPEILELGTKEDFVAWYKDLDFNKYKKVKLVEDIDLSGEVGLVTRKFTGVFDGNNKVISNMTVSPSEADELLGFFGKMSSATVKNLILDNFTAENQDAEYAGGIAAYIQNGTVISGCKIRNSKISGFIAGGLVGRADRSTVEGCEVLNTSVTAPENVGGLIGATYSGNKLQGSYFSGNVTCTYKGGAIGGVLGYNESNNDLISCYSTATVNPDKSSDVGGIYGESPFGALNMKESYYAGPNTELEGISKEELKGKKDAMNSAISTSGFEYVINEDSSTKDELPLVIVNKKAE